MNPADLSDRHPRHRDGRRAATRRHRDRGRRGARAPEQPRARRLGHERRDEAREAARRRTRASSRPSSPPSVGALDGIASVDVAGPGFINITLDAAAAGALAKTIVEAGAEYGRGDLYTKPDGTGVRINLEFVSANPTGPIHIGGVRWAAVGDSLARIFQAQGAEVTREYYFNDHGAQIDRFARSLLASYLGEPTPEDGYGGAYISDIAARVIALYPGDLLHIPRDEQQEVFRVSRASSSCSATSRRACTTSASTSTCTSTRTTLHESGAVEHAIAATARARRTSTRPTARSGSARRTSATTTIASSSSPTASPATSPATSPTTSTSASAASSATSSCSAPTTTATCAGSWR